MLKKYTFIRLVGGLGNQLYIYAFGLAHSKKHNTELIIDNKSGFGERDFYGGVFALNGLSIKEKFIDRSLFRFIVANRYFWFLARKLKLSFVEEDTSKYHQDIWYVNSQFYEGYWQSFKYFNDHRETIKKNLLLSSSKRSEISVYENKILGAKNSVALCMRFYEANPDNENIYKVYDEEYYNQAMELLESKEENLTYFIFTINIERAKKLLSKSNNKDIVFINPMEKMIDANLDLHLMSLCKHFIISNSTLYWWAAYIGEQEGSYVISPKNSFLNKDAILPNWVMI